MRKMLCRAGLHRWSRWRPTSVWVASEKRSVRFEHRRCWECGQHQDGKVLPMLVPELWSAYNTEQEES